jgi:hypothetical protein
VLHGFGDVFGGDRGGGLPDLPPRISLQGTAGASTCRSMRSSSGTRAPSRHGIRTGARASNNCCWSGNAEGLAGDGREGLVL